MSNLAIKLPWWGKLLTKSALTHLPIDYRRWARMGMFRHGAMDEPAYALGVFRQHFGRAQQVHRLHEFVGLELGPGDSLSSAVIAASFGATRYYLVDVDQFANTEPADYRRLSTYLAANGWPGPNLEEATCMDEILDACRAHYLTRGLRSLQTIPSGSVDYIWSHVVLQHIRRAEFQECMRECRRILRPTGVCSHRVDLTDLMNWSLNNLRFSPKMWESSFIAGSGYYTNRIRYSEMLAMFTEAGFTPTVTAIERWPALPVARERMWDTFRTLPEEELSVSTFDVLLTPTT